MEFLADRYKGASRIRGWVLALAAGVAAVTMAMAMAAPAAYASNRAMSWGDDLWGKLGNGVSALNVEEGAPVKFRVPAPVCAAGTIGTCPGGPYLNELSGISAGGSHSLALLSNGGVMAWGENESGQLGDGTHTGPGTCVFVDNETELTAHCSATPVAVSGLSEVSAISAGGSHSLALKSNGTVMAWGANGNGQLGDSTTENSDLPVTVSKLSGVTAISAGRSHSLALLSDGAVMAWGQNESGQLGDGTTKDRHLPVAVSGLSQVIAISAGGSHSLALLSNGTVMAWGANGSGQLGDGTTESSALPVAVSGLSGVTAVAAGEEHSLVLLSNGAVMAWGQNGDGRLGDGKFENSDVPVAVSGLSGVSAVSAGANHSMALLTTGSVMAWGNPCSGQLGNGTGRNGREVCIILPSDAFPAEATGLSDVNGISAGGEDSLAFGPAAPSVSGVSPTQGLEAGGTSVTITGTNFSQASAVHFGSTSASSFTMNSATSITAVSPPQSAGTVDVTVTTPEGTSSIVSADRFKYIPVPPPAVTKVKPRIGSITGDTTVTITGSSFTEVSSVKFGSVEATSFTVNSATSITAVSPPELAGRVDVTVTTPIGTSALSSKDHFTFTPTITNVSRDTGAAAGGSIVTVSGTGFLVGTSATKFKFGKTPGTSVNCASTTSCTVVAPAHTAGTVDVKAIVNKAASPKNPPADQFTYG